MSEITDKNPFLPSEATIVVPAMEVPSYRAHRARTAGVDSHILIHTQGGLGDYICAEPSMRWAIDRFQGKADFSLATECPDLFRHLPWTRVYDLSREQPEWDKYLTVKTLWDPGHIHGEFIGQLVTHCVDYSSIAMWRAQLPISYRQPYLAPTAFDIAHVASDNEEIEGVVIHPGLSWPSKTLPADWWNEVIKTLLYDHDVRVILVGFDIPSDTAAYRRGTVDVDTTGCADLRNKLTRMQTVALLQRARVVLTNDSAPLHMAATGRAHIGFLSTAKHPDLVTHWRNDEWGWRMKSFTKSCVADELNLSVNNFNVIDFSQGDVRKYLPEPGEVADWAYSVY